mgnify:CR=1 FL=1
MKLKVKILGLRKLNELDNYWQDTDYRALLKLYDFPDANEVDAAELKEMLYMSITDFEPDEAAKILLTYKLSEQLSEGQIQSLSHEMITDKIAEEYPEPEMHYDLFNINQLLHKAYNGTFPNTEASIIEIEILNEDAANIEITEEIMTKLISGALTEKSILKRLYADQLDGDVPFGDASKFIWTLDKKSSNTYELLTSTYWIEKEDIVQDAYECKIAFFEGE